MIPTTATAALATCFLMAGSLAWGAVSVSAGHAEVVTTISFDEIPFRPVNGLRFEGVSYDFKINGVDSNDAFFNSFGPGDLTHVSDPSLTGNSAGVLTFDFQVPTSFLEFGVALNTAETLTPGLRVELFDSSLRLLTARPIDVFTVAGGLGFAENRFAYQGAEVSRAVIDFLHEPGSFALDNLSYAAVPESSSLFHLVAALSVALALRCSVRGRVNA